ncbi:MAG: nucleotide exchange factor GrpE [Nitrospirae bacterium]|nr:nucleotide exchange factor GrpE [Nitrospirota bacterium]
MEDEKRVVDITVGDTGVEYKAMPTVEAARESAADATAAEKAGESDRLRQDLAELNDRFLRHIAEFENYKRRVQKEKDELIKYGTESLVTELLPVIDNLESALNHACDVKSTNLAKGVELTLKELKKILAGRGLQEIESKGKPFDPKYHEAMGEVVRDDLDKRTVVEELRKGYLLKDRLVRASMVMVSKKGENSGTKGENASIKDEDAALKGENAQ